MSGAAVAAAELLLLLLGPRISLVAVGPCARCRLVSCDGAVANGLEGWKGGEVGGGEGCCW